jgi:hypothetical protein
MTAIGIGIGVCFGGGVSSPAPVTPMTLLPSVTVLQWHDTSLGLVAGSGGDATKCDQLTDLGPAADKHSIQATSAAKPTIVPTGLNSKPTILADGVDDLIACAGLTLPAPTLIAPIWFWAILNQRGYTNTDSLCGAVAVGNNLRIVQSNATPLMRQNAGTNGNTNNGAAINAWVRMRAMFNNDTSNYIRLGSTNATGVNCGATTAAGRQIFAAGSGTFGNFELAAWVITLGEPTGPEQTALDAWAADPAQWGNTFAVG